MRVVPATPSALEEAVRILRQGGIVVYPTETAYGLAADPLNPTAVERVYALKGRGEQKPLGLIAATEEQVAMVADVHAGERPLMERWPAALSIVFDVREQQEEAAQRALTKVTGGSGTVSIRIPPHDLARSLAEVLGRPIVATSANRSGAPTCYSAQAVQEQFAVNPTPDLLLDGGTLPVTPPSTVVRVEGGVPRILRHGPVTL